MSRPAVAKFLHVSLRTLHNWETGKVRIPYAAYKLLRLFNSYEIFHPIWKNWRFVGARLVTPEGHSFEAGNFHWLSLMARRAEAFSTVNRQLAALRVQVKRHSQGKSGTGQDSVPPHEPAPLLPASAEPKPIFRPIRSSGFILSKTTFSISEHQPSANEPDYINQQLSEHGKSLETQSQPQAETSDGEACSKNNQPHRLNRCIQATTSPTLEPQL